MFQFSRSENINSLCGFLNDLLVHIIQICFKKFPSYKIILLIGGIFYLEFK